MRKKKPTQKENVSDALLKFREKRKWQLALRRYVLEKHPSAAYAPFFGLDNDHFRKWIELQFSEDLNWDNFGLKWQFDHIVPVAYFDFSKIEDLELCWNFINIRVEKIELNKARGNRVDVLGVKTYFEALYEKTGHPVCVRMVAKITTIEVSNIIAEPKLEQFIADRKEHFDILSSLTPDEFISLNQGKTLSEIMIERELVRRFG